MPTPSRPPPPRGDAAAPALDGWDLEVSPTWWDTASAISPIEKNTKSVDGISSTRSVAPQLPPLDSRCRSIPGVGEPEALGRHVIVVQALRGVQDDGAFQAQVRFQMSQQVFEVGVRRLVRADVLGGVDGVELHAELAVRGGDALAVHVGQDDELVAPLEDAQRVGCVGERGPVRHGGAERLVELGAALQLQGCPRCSCARGTAGRDKAARVWPAPGGSHIVRRPGGPSPRETLFPAPPLRMMSGCRASPDPAFPVDQGAVAVEGEDAVVGQSGHDAISWIASVTKTG